MVIEASENFFDYGFLSCRSLIIKLFPHLDLSKITMEAVLTAAVEVTFRTTSGVCITELLATPPTEVLLTEVLASLAKVPIVEVAPMEPTDKDLTPALSANILQTKA